MVEFLGFDDQPDPDRVRRAVEHSALNTLRTAEQRKDRSSDRQRSPFFGRGLSNQSLTGYGDVENAYQRLLRDDEELTGLAERFGYAG